MSNTNLPFTLTEYETRLIKVRAAMEAMDCEVLIVTDPASMAWLTGYNGWSFYVHQAVIIGPIGAPLWWGRMMDAIGAKRTVYMAANNIFGYEDTYVQNPDKHPMEDLAQLMKAQGWSGSRIGLEMDNYYFTAAAYLSLVQELPDAKWVNANVLVNWQRTVKSEAEIVYMRCAAKIVEKMHATILEHAEPGMKKNTLIADIYYAGIMGADEHWGDYPSIVPLAPSGNDATAPHLTWDDAELQSGEATFFEIAGVYKRYHAPQSRTLFLGNHPRNTEKQRPLCLRP
jgi:ectoine hydrolase